MRTRSFFRADCWFISDHRSRLQLGDAVLNIVLAMATWCSWSHSQDGAKPLACS